MIARNSVREVVKERKEEENSPAILPSISSSAGLNITFASGKTNYFQPAFSLQFHVFGKI